MRLIVAQQNWTRRTIGWQDSNPQRVALTFSDVENYKENAYKMTNSLTVFYALKIAQIFKIF